MTKQDKYELTKKYYQTNETKKQAERDVKKLNAEMKDNVSAGQYGEYVVEYTPRAGALRFDWDLAKEELSASILKKLEKYWVRGEPSVALNVGIVDTAEEVRAEFLSDLDNLKKMGIH